MKLKLIIPILIIKLIFSLPSLSNNIQVSNVTLTGQNSADDYTYVQFDLSWENSWRTSAAPNNWDAAWVFVKYRVSGGEWQHARLNINGHTDGSGTEAIIQSGVVDETQPFNNSSNPVVGVFMYRNLTGNGTFAVSGAKLRWNYGANGLTDTDQVDVKVFAIEMVYVAPGSFYLGSGGTETSVLYSSPSITTPFLISGEHAIPVGSSSGNLYYNGSAYGGDQLGPVPTSFPKGYAGFYSMKYEISQQQYVDFLNCLTPLVAVNRAWITGNYRNGLTVSGNVYSTSLPYLSCNNLGWADGAAYCDWAGLRPMTETEFEKACRGPLESVPNECAWGSINFTPANNLSNPGLENETATNTGANVHALWSVGPVRNGIFAKPGSSRSESGASYWGILDLSGNNWEMVITIGNPSGRNFTGLHGNGTLSGDGHDVTNWPSVHPYIGAGFRGGSWAWGKNLSEVSDRTYATYATGSRSFDWGFRACRSIPVNDFICGISTVSDIDGNVYATVQIGAQCWIKENLKVSKNPGGISITKYCYNNSAANCDIYGALYDWATVMNGALGSNTNPSGVQGICMDGWHVPSHDEWLVLTAFLGGESVAGGKLKSPRTQPTAAPSWYAPNTGASDESGFSGIPGGYNIGSLSYFDIPYVGYWWTATDIDINTARARYLNYSTTGIVSGYSWFKAGGFSLRCIKDL